MGNSPLANRIGKHRIFSTSSRSGSCQTYSNRVEEAAAAGKGAASLDGHMIDAASARMAENVVKQDEVIQAKSK